MPIETIDTSAKLIDPFGRAITYLRLSVTDRCDFRCTYCMNDDMTFLPRTQVLSLEQLSAIAKAFVDLGVEKIRLTGGEPLIRKNIPWLLKSIGQQPQLKELCLTTNGSHLAQYAQDIYRAGIRRINVSIDSLNTIKFKKMTRHGDLNQVLDGIQTARRTGIETIKINSVIQRHTNLDEVQHLVQFALDNQLDISFIEEMPLGKVDSHNRADEFVPSAEIRALIEQKYTLQKYSLTVDHANSSGPSKYWSIPGYDSLIGFISPHSENFCASCNRVRVTVEGKLLLCLGNEHSLDLKHILEHQPDDIEYLKQAIVDAMANKPEKHHFNLTEEPQIVRFMNATGG